MATHSSILAWEIHGQRSLVGYGPWSHKELEDFATKYQSYHNVNVFEKYHYISFTQSRDFLLLQDTLYAGNLWLSQST